MPYFSRPRKVPVALVPPQRCLCWSLLPWRCSLCHLHPFGDVHVLSPHPTKVPASFLLLWRCRCHLHHPWGVPMGHLLHPGGTHIASLLPLGESLWLLHHPRTLCAASPPPHGASCSISTTPEAPMLRPHHSMGSLKDPHHFGGAHAPSPPPYGVLEASPSLLGCPTQPPSPCGGRPCATSMVSPSPWLGVPSPIAAAGPPPRPLQHPQHWGGSRPAFVCVCPQL